MLACHKQIEPLAAFLPLSAGDLQSWTELNHMAMNHLKTEIMLLITNQKRQNVIIPFPKIHPSTQPVTKVQSRKPRGVTLNNSLSWCQHILAISKTMSRIKHLNLFKVFSTLHGVYLLFFQTFNIYFTIVLFCFPWVVAEYYLGLVFVGSFVFLLCLLFVFSVFENNLSVTVGEELLYSNGNVCMAQSCFLVQPATASTPLTTATTTTRLCAGGCRTARRSATGPSTAGLLPPTAQDLWRITPWGRRRVSLS